MPSCVPRRCYLLGEIGNATAERVKRSSEGRCLKECIFGDLNTARVSNFIVW